MRLLMPAWALARPGPIRLVGLAHAAVHQGIVSNMLQHSHGFLMLTAETRLEIAVDKTQFHDRLAKYSR